MKDRARPLLVDYFYLVLLAATFGSSFMFVKIALVEIPSVALVTLRLGIAAAIFLVAMFVVGQRLPAIGKIWFSIFAAAATGYALPFFLITWGQEKVDAGLAAILMAIMPLMTIVLAHFFTNDEKLTIFKIVGFCFGILGVVVMIGFDKLGTLGEETVRQYAITGAALCYAVNAIVTKSLIQLPRVAMMCALTLVSTLMMLPVFVLNGDAANMVTWTWEASNAVIAVIILAIFPTALGMIMIFMIVSRQGASFLSQINFMVPIFGVLFGILFLAEIIQGNAIIALALILAGVAIARIRPKAKVTYPKEVNS